MFVAFTERALCGLYVYLVVFACRRVDEVDTPLVAGEVICELAQMVAVDWGRVELPSTGEDNPFACHHTNVRGEVVAQIEPVGSIEEGIFLVDSVEPLAILIRELWRNFAL